MQCNILGLGNYFLFQKIIFGQDILFQKFEENGSLRWEKNVGFSQSTEENIFYIQEN